MSRSGLLAASRISLSALLLAAAPLRAQSPETAPLRQPENVPFELAAALTSAGGMSGEPQILVGSVPGWVADRVAVPLNGRILGSAFYGTTAVAILTIPSVDDSLLPEFKRELMKRGWLNSPPFPTYGGGFRAAPLSASASNRITLCGDRQSLFASVARRQGSASYITVRIAAAGQGSNCMPTPLPAGFPRQMVMPTVYHPEGLSESRLGADCARPQEINRTSAVIKSSMSTDALLDHYARQLQDSGWVAASKGTTTSARTFTRLDSAGVSKEIVLSVSNAGSDTACRELSMSLHGTRTP